MGHLHVKDVVVDTPRAMLEVKKLGEGQLAKYFGPIANVLRTDGYNGVISLESVYHPGSGNFEEGFRENIDLFKKTFA